MQNLKKLLILLTPISNGERANESYFVIKNVLSEVLGKTIRKIVMEMVYITK